jgi:hypothetical protein
MKPAILGVLSLLWACGGIEVAQPKPTTVNTAATDTSTATATGSATSTAPQVVVNNNINNTQNNGTDTSTATAAAVATAHPGLIAKGDTEAEVQAVLGTPTMLQPCNGETTGWWFSYYCIGFTNGVASTQFDVPGDKLYLPSW